MSNVSAAICKMTNFYNRESNVRLHDINHFMKVWGFAHTIGLEEGLDPAVQETLELAAIVHDIACTLCRSRYGEANGKHQELEGGPLARSFYEEFHLPDSQLDRIVCLVSHHHTYTDIDGIDYQILLEADFLVNADESSLSRKAAENFRDRVFRTKSGLLLLEKLYF